MMGAIFDISILEGHHLNRYYIFLYTFVMLKSYWCIVLMFQVVQRFQELFAQTKYKEAAELAAESPQGLLRTPDTVAKFQVVTFNCNFFFVVKLFISCNRIVHDVYDGMMHLCK